MIKKTGAVLGLFLSILSIAFLSPPAPINIGAGSVLINEVAWMGSASNAADEWGELYN